MSAYYNEIDPYAAQWCRNLIAAGHIAPGDVDERSVADVRADDLRTYRQCHFFAGIGIWSYALRLAEWPDEREVWTGSCPCQPFSVAGRSGGFDDSRHLWPHWARLIGECRPVVIFGEQVASADGLAWLDFVCADLEAADYAVGAVDTCAAGVGAPHIRQRLWFVGESYRAGPQPRREASTPMGHGDSVIAAGSTSKLADAGHNEWSTWPARHEHESEASVGAIIGSCSELGDASGAGLAQRPRTKDGRGAVREEGAPVAQAGTNGFWRDADWLPCIDGKARPVESGTFPLAHGVTARVGRLRAYGNALVAPAATEFIRAYRELAR